ADPARGEPGADLPLLLPGALEACAQLGVRGGPLAPTLDTARRLEPRDGRDKMPARQVVGRREGLAGIVIRLLLGHGRPPEGTPDDDPPEGAGRTPELSLHDGAVVHCLSLAGVR